MNTRTRQYQLLRCALCTIGLCTAASAAVSFDFNSKPGGFTSTFNTAEFNGPWTYGAASGAGGSGGWSTEGQGPESNHPNTTDLTSALLGVIAAGTLTLSFEHRWSFETDGNNWDGGAVFLSVNGGAFNQVLTANFSANPYNGVVAAGSASELKGLLSFVGKSAGYDAGTFLTSTATLGPFVIGDTLRVRFRAAADTNTSSGAPDWAVDNISLANVDIIPEPSTGMLGVMALLGLLQRRKRR